MKPSDKIGVLMLAVILAGAAPVYAQTPTPVAVAPAGTPQAAAATPAPTALAPISATPAPVATDAARQALEPVRQAIAAKDFAAAQQALDRARQVIPNDPAIAVYDNLIKNGLGQGQVNQSRSVIRTPIPGVTPLPTVETPTPTPEPTPVATPASASTDAGAGSSGGIADKAQDLLKNQNVLYGLYGLGGLIVLLVLYAIFRKRKAGAEESSDIYEEPTPVPGTLSAVGGGGLDFSGNYDALASSPGSDFPAATDFSAMNDTGAGGAALGGAAMNTAAPEFTAFGFGDEEESAPAKPALVPRPAPAPEDDLPVSLTDDEPTAILQPEAPSPTATPAAGGVSFESLGLTPPSAPATPPPAAASSSPAGTPGTVNLDDIFGNQPLPGTEDANSETLPTFVSTPGSESPEENVELPPRQDVRPAPAEEKDLTISFDELFGSTSTSQPAVTPQAAPETPAPAPAAQSEQSIEDALAATLGAMQAQEPGEAPVAAAGTTATPSGNESLDERTERMFHDQMEKARAAMAEKNWRQAVHVLSIASALHPEHEEAKQMLREARAEKRKSEESV